MVNYGVQSHQEQVKSQDSAAHMSTSMPVQPVHIWLELVGQGRAESRPRLAGDVRAGPHSLSADEQQTEISQS